MRVPRSDTAAVSLKICHLAPWEADDLSRGLALDHRKHQHVSVRKALALTEATGGCRWVGRRAIVQVRDYAWRPHQSGGFEVLQMVPERTRT
jgi:hypothetical protein